QAAGHHRRQPDRTGTHHGHDVTGLDLAVADPDLEAGGQDVRQRHGGVVGHTLGDPVQGVVRERHPYELRLRAVDQVTEHPADARCALVGQAVGVEALVAVRAGAAGADAGDDHAVTDGVRGDGRPDLHDSADTFVPEDATLDHGGHVALENVQVRPTDRGGLDPHHDVGRLLDRGIGDFFP